MRGAHGRNHTLVREVFCRSSGVFSQRDIESLRRNKRALLRVSDEIRAALARIPPASQDAAERANVSDNRRVVIDYRAIKRRNLKVSCRVVSARTYLELTSQMTRRRRCKRFCKATIGSSRIFTTMDFEDGSGYVG